MLWSGVDYVLDFVEWGWTGQAGGRVGLGGLLRWKPTISVPTLSTQQDMQTNIHSHCEAAQKHTNAIRSGCSVNSGVPD